MRRQEDDLAWLMQLNEVALRELNEARVECIRLCQELGFR